MAKKRIVVTGTAIISCLGEDVENFFSQLLEGKSGISLIEKFDTADFPTKFAGEVRFFSEEKYIELKQARRYDRSISYALVAGNQALEEAGIGKNSAQLDYSRIGCVIGSGMGGMQVFYEGSKNLIEKGVNRVSPFFVPYILTHMGGALLAKEFGFTGPNYSVSTACATANNAIYSAAEHIRRGETDIMVCGGTEAAVIPIGVAGFNACKALSRRNEAPQKASRPWDKERDGFVLGEGAGILVLEEYEHAKKRGAKILGEYLGGALTCDAYHITEPRPDGASVKLCVEKALQDAGILASDINYINAHATSTQAGDLVEVGALAKVFKNPEKIFMNATKSMIGHALGAAAAMEAVVCIKTLQKGICHPTLNLDNREEGINFLISNQAQEYPFTYALSNAFGFGGHNASVIFKKVE
jgi:3-oxoacyl-[acyl-carrier-protein] synthase II